MGQNISTIFEDCLKRKDRKKEHVEVTVIQPKDPDPDPDPESISVALSVISTADSVLPLPPTVKSNGFKRDSVNADPIETVEKPKRLLFAGRRVWKPPNASDIVLIDPKTAQVFKINEKSLHDVCLGDFLTASIGKDGRLCDIEKAKAPGNANVKVEGDVAYVLNQFGKLQNLSDRQVFQSKHFAPALSNEALQIGTYHVRISLLAEPVTLSNGTLVQLEGTNAKMTGTGPWKGNKEKKKKERKSEGPPNNQVIFGAGFEEEKSQNLNENEAPTAIIYGPGFKEDNPAPSSVPPQCSTSLDEKSMNIVENPTSKSKKKKKQAKPFDNEGFQDETGEATVSISQFLPDPSSPNKHRKFLFAGRRILLDESSNLLILLVSSPENDLFTELESVLEAKNIKLGDFLEADFVPGIGLCNYSRTLRTGDFKVEVQGDIAFATNIAGVLSHIGSIQLFRTPLFPEALYRHNTLTPGVYIMKIGLLEEPYQLPNGLAVIVEASDPRPMH